MNGFNMIIRVLLFLVVSMCSAQQTNIDYITYSDNIYYEILKQKDEYRVITYSLNDAKIVKDTLHFLSIKEVQNKLQLKSLLKTKRLTKESSLYRNSSDFGAMVETNKIKNALKRLDIDIKTEADTTYSFFYNGNSNKELWYLSGDSSLEIYDRIWCKSKEQPTFNSVNHEKFDVVLVTWRSTLGVIYFDKKTGVQGNIRF